MATSGSFLQSNGAERTPNTKVYDLEKETEVRCEVAWDSPVSVKLLRGTAEIFGTEIAQGQTVVFNNGTKFAVRCRNYLFVVPLNNSHEVVVEINKVRKGIRNS